MADVPTKKKQKSAPQVEEIHVAVKRLPWYKRLWEWIISIFIDEFELIVWFHDETEFTDRGNKTIRRTKRTFILKKITKKKPNWIVGKDIFGKPFEIKTVEPFDYQIRKLR